MSEEGGAVELSAKELAQEFLASFRDSLPCSPDAVGVEIVSRDGGGRAR